jgi:tRNA(Leu) C34 or U34 (ribose-2'-O)-methylase TrmL
MKLTVLLWDVESGMNLGLAVRTCYMLGHGVIGLKIFDPQDRMKLKANDVRLFSSYTVDYYGDIEISTALDAMLRFVEFYTGRVVCACNDEKASIDLDHFTFCDNDLVVFGNEYHGIPEAVMKRANEKIVIPMYGSNYIYSPRLGGKTAEGGYNTLL